MKKNLTVKYRVSPMRSKARFPIDMLRYDMAYPAAERESAKIENATTWNESPCSQETDDIELIATASGCPNGARWFSFGWRVTHVWNGAQWESYNPGYSAHKVVK